MEYDYKAAKELVWAVLTAMAIPIAAALATVDPEQVVNWRTWLLGVVAATVRAGGGALLAWLTANRAT